MSYLSKFKELNGGYVSFGGNPKGGKITGKGKIKSGKLDFDSVYFVKELKFNLFSVSQMCNKKNNILFTDTKCLVLSPDFKLLDENQVLLRVPRENNMYNVNLKHIVPSWDLTCLFAKATIDESNLWHRRLGHINFKTINKLVKGHLVRGLPIKVFENDNTCVACKKGKQHKASYQTKPVSTVNQPFFRLHMDLFGPNFVKSLNKKSYCLVITDDYSRFTWVKVIRSNNGTEFKNSDLNQFYGVKGIRSEFSIPRTPQQNGIAERKNKTLIEDARTMLADSLLPIPFWAEAVNTACYVQNRVLVTKPHNKTPYELLHGRTPSIGFMRPFGSPVTILNTLDPLGKFQEKVNEGFLVGYSVSSKAFRVFNSRTCIIRKTLHVNFLENKPNVASFHDTIAAEKAGEEVNRTYVLFPVWSASSTNPQNNDEDATLDGKEHDFDTTKPESVIILSSSSSAQSRKQDDKTKKKDKGKSLVESFTGYRDLNAEFEDCSENNRNKVNAAGSIVLTIGQNSLNSTNTFSVAGPSNTAVSPTYRKSSFIDASQLPNDPDMPKLEDITYSDDEDVGGAEADFSNLESSIPVRFEDPNHPDKVYQVVKELYRLHQAPRAWYDTLASYLLENGFQRGTIDQTLFIKKQKGDILLDKYVAKILSKFGLTKGKSASTPIDIEKPLLKDPDGKDVDCKKQTVVATSSTEAEYVADASCCAQVLLIQNQLLDYGEGFNQVINFLNGNYIQYALTINPHIYVSCIKQFWNTVVVKQTNDVTRLQALVDKKKVVITEATIRDTLRLDDAEGVDCLPNEENFAELTRIGYGKPSTKLTFYKAFFSSQWKCLIHTILQSMSAKHTSWNEFSSAMASAVICLSTGVETPLFEGMLVVGVIEEEGDAEEQVQDGDDDVAAQGANTAVIGDVVQDQSIPSPTPHTPPPQQYQDPPLTSQYDKVAQALEITKLKRRAKKLEKANRVKVLKLRRLKKVKTSQRIDSSDDTVMEDASNQGRMIDALDSDAGVALMDDKEEEKKQM
nr:putative ribonuclease H-like domain-containing protein [Tanacetum cinerariifolium]